MAKIDFITFDEKIQAEWGLHKIEKAVLEKEIAELRAENEKLRKALKPFADAVLKDEYSWKYDINGDDFRAAAAAIREIGDE